MTLQSATLSPTSEKQRYIILDALRGFALLGICLANLPEFSLWTFLSPEAQDAMHSAHADHITRFLQFFLFDSKFYGIFSILFGIGFSIILSHAQEKGRSGILLFYRRLIILFFIAMTHLLLIWSGDILCLYAITGMFLPLVSKWSDKKLLLAAGICLFLPVVLNLWQESAQFRLSQPIEEAWWRKANSYGIYEENFATWLRDAKSYKEVHQFLMQGAIERMWEFVEGHRLPKVLGLFIIGFVIGRNRLYAKLPDIKPQLIKTCWLTFVIGLPTSLLYAFSAVHYQPWGLTVHSLLHLFSSLSFALFYMTGLCLLFLKRPENRFFKWFSKPGRMALTNYIGQSLFGIIIYYGIAFGLGLSMGLWQVELTAIAIFILQIMLSAWWLRFFRFGPIEWVWRMLTYGKWLPLKK